MAYVSALEYVNRYGEWETARLTNEADGDSGGVDEVKLTAALSDAQEEAESYISVRYATPLATTPPVVKGWVAAIARLKLHETTGRENPAVVEAASRAMRQLEFLASGRINLPIEEGGTAAETSSGDPITSGDGACDLFGGDALNGFLGPIYGGCPLPAWRCE